MGLGQEVSLQLSPPVLASGAVPVPGASIPPPSLTVHLALI